MSAVEAIMLAVSVAVLAYLTYALLRGERL
ncbi:MAG: potassium-transporting ATPase subunit F [Solirubrobacterales bacterium]